MSLRQPAELGPADCGRRHLTGLLDDIDAGVVATDPAFTVTGWNPGAERMYGYSAAEVLGHPAREIAVLAGDRSLARLERELMKRGRSRIELVAQRRDGIHIEIEINAVAVRAQPDGELIGYLAIHQDVTQRRRLERERRRLLAVLENSTDFIGVADLDGTPTYLNPAGRRLVGLEASVGLETTSLEDYFAPEHRERVLQELVPGIMREGRRAWELEFAHTTTGERIPVSWDGFRVDDPVTGEPIALATITRDLTEIRRQEAALRASEHRMEVVVEGVTDAFCIFDEHLRCAYLNARALLFVTDLAGRSLAREDLVGRVVSEVFPGFAGSDVEAHVLTAAHKQQTVVFELPVQDRWFHIHVSPSAHGTTVAIHEITDRKLAEADRRRRTQQQSALADLARLAAIGNDLQGLLGDAVDAIAAVLGADLVLIAEHEPADDRFRLRSAAGCAPEAVGQLLGDMAPASLLGRAMARSDPIVCDDVRELRAVVLPGEATAGVVVGVPGTDRPFGALAVLTRQPRKFGRDEIDFLRAAANVLATAAERARGHRALADVRDAERRRIARALHDEALQELGQAVTLAAAEGSVQGHGEPSMVTILRSVAEHVRAAIHDLRLGEEDTRPISELVEELAENHRRLAPHWTLELRTRALPAGPLGLLGAEVLRVIGEALTNARRHADATTVSVHAWASSGCLWADVHDNGRGFDPQAPLTGPDSKGLIGIRERAALLGGRVNVTSAPGEGTVVRIGVPLPERAEAGERLRLLLVEDHAAVREAIACALEAEPDVGDVRQAGSLAEARAMTQDVDVAVIDLALPDGSGADLINDVRRDSPDAHALIITTRADRAGAASAVERGAAGVFTEEAHLQDVIEAIRRLRRGEPLMPLDEVVELLRLAGRQREQELDGRRALDTLTAREREVLQLLADGLDNRAAADRLHVSPRTHRNHVANILAKLGVHSQLQALLFALRYGVVEIGHPGAPA